MARGREQLCDSIPVSLMQRGCCDEHSPGSSKETGFLSFVPFLTLLLCVLNPNAAFVFAKEKGHV